jgi:TRAP-type transport system small permease protein
VTSRTEARVDRTLEAIEQWIIIPLLACLLAFITVGVFIQVVMRYVFATSFLWGEELSLFAFIWSVFLGAVVGVRRRIHLGFDFLPELLTGRWAVAQRLVINLSILAVALLLLLEGWTFALLSVQRLSPALGISLFVPTLVIPISGGLMSLIALRDLAQDVRQLAAVRSN